MVIKPKKNRNQIAEIKLKMLEIITADPHIGYNELARRLGINNHTSKKYKLELEAVKGRIREEVRAEVKERVEVKVGIWQKIAKTLGL